MYGFRRAMLYTSVYIVCIFSPLMNLVHTTEALNDSSCRTVAEVFDKRVGPADNIPVSPLSDAFLNECSGTLRYTGGSSCCNADMEGQFQHVAAGYLRQHIQLSNKKLKTRITQSLNLYQEHLQLSMEEASNKTSNTLSTLYKIPRDAHQTALETFFQQLNNYLLGNDDLTLTEIIERFFVSLFPSVFDYVLSDPSKPKTADAAFHSCLLEHYKEIQPFGNAPKHIGTKIKFAFRRARIYTETLKVMIGTIDTTDNIEVHMDCRKAISRLHFCSLCSGEVETRPCRGLCLNVMRGCLAGVSEISSSWDELVVAFENLHLGMLKQNTAQELLSYLDGNVTDALLQAMDDGPRIYARVMTLCRESQKSEGDTALFKKFFTPEAPQPSHPSSRIHSIRRDITSLIGQLEDSKGFFQRIADGLCRTQIYDQEMQSDRCWNGSTVGRYMHEVTEANTISQAQHNMEVRITLIPDQVLLNVKDTLAHMRKNLSHLHNEELMLNDETYKTVVGSGGGYSTQGRDVIIDDEDFAEGASASGSGDKTDDVDEEKTTETTRPTGDVSRGQGSTGGVSPGSSGTVGGSGVNIKDNRSGVEKQTEKPSRPKGSSASTVPTSFTLLFMSAVLSRMHVFL